MSAKTGTSLSSKQHNKYLAWARCTVSFIRERNFSAFISTERDVYLSQRLQDDSTSESDNTNYIHHISFQMVEEVSAAQISNNPANQIRTIYCPAEDERDNMLHWPKSNTQVLKQMGIWTIKKTSLCWWKTESIGQFGQLVNKSHQVPRGSQKWNWKKPT